MDFTLAHEDITGADTPHPRTVSGRVQFALSGFLSPVLTGSQLVSFPAGTKMFQFPAFPLPDGSKFGYPCVKDRVRLDRAFRSLPRPSSALKPSHSLYG